MGHVASARPDASGLDCVAQGDSNVLVVARNGSGVRRLCEVDSDVGAGLGFVDAAGVRYSLVEANQISHQGPPQPEGGVPARQIGEGRGVPPEASK